VVQWHCRRSGGGVAFSDGPSLATAIADLAGDPAGARAMAEAGRRYVLADYSWPVVLDRMEGDLDLLRTEGAA